MRSASVVKVDFTDAGLYGVFIGEMLGQFSDGHWENSTMHRCDWQLFHTATTFLTDKTPEELPTIRYNIEEFFAVVKKFRRIGTLLNKQFNHVKNYYDLKTNFA